MSKVKQATKAKSLVHESRMVLITELKKHAKNYRSHPPEQIRHITESIKQHGFYRNVVVAKDLTILAGHGSVEAAAQAGLKEVPVVQLDILPSDPKALKILAADNELQRLAEDDSALLSSILEAVKDSDIGLLGTGYSPDDVDKLMRSVAITTPDLAAGEWLGMPEFSSQELDKFRVTVHFKSAEDRAAFFKFLSKEQANVVWWPDHDGHKGSDTAVSYQTETSGDPVPAVHPVEV